ncbi:HlyD family secretion protein [Legionella busanensis]|uniref:HlyD family secretion protein n=1 Tax=Legionella busanensis TaxID=190655 RepID=A0A378JIQ2_9GAMM|nr:HlyD family efflux transporter periplasmic adaptor subunit [Legionella busanensis]STX51034.1 HlyD family secretion protein [Legionella busanensis]
MKEKKNSSKLKKGTLTEADEAFISDSKSALLNRSTPLAHGILITFIILFITLLIWAYFARIEEITTGEGKIIPFSQVKSIQSLDGGIVAQIMVKEGDLISQGKVLMLLDNTRFKADYSQAYEKYLALSAIVARFNAEVEDQKTIVFPKIIKNHPELMRRETNLFNERKKALLEQLQLLQHSHDLVNEEVKMYGPLLKKGYASKLEYLRSVRAADDFKIKMRTLKDKFREQALTDLNSHKAELAIVIEQLNSLKDKMVRTTIISPVKGIVKKLNVVTVGGVIKPGDVIMEIVPFEDYLLVQAKINPKDIGFVHIGQDATVKVTAYDYSIYGGLPGKVVYVSADAIT